MSLTSDPQQRSSGGQEDEHVSSGWRGFLSSVGLSIPAGLCRLAPPALRLGQRRMLQGKAPEVPEHVLRLAGVGPGKLRAEWSLPGFVTMFLPEFPLRPVPGHEHFQVQVSSDVETKNRSPGLSQMFFSQLLFASSGAGLHCQRFIWTHSESEGQGQTENICC